MPSTLLKNARLLDPWTHLDQPGDLLAINGLITALGAEAAPAAPEGAVVIECGGHCLAPGLVDMRVGLREPGHEYVESLAISSQAAAAGGITSLVGLPDTDPVLDDIALIEFITRRAAKVGLVNIYAFGAATRGLRGQDLTEMGLMAAAGALGFTDGGRAIADALVMRRALSYARTFDLLVVQHPEEPRLAAGGAATEGEIATRLGLPGITPAAELIMVERDLRLVEITGGRYHAAHLSTAAAIDAIRKAKRRGLPVTCDTAPPYFALNETAIGEYRSFAKLSPPLRSETDRLAVVEGLKDGTIDAIASDHQPRDADDKRLPFADAAPGGAGLATLLGITLVQVQNGALTMPQALALLTKKPAEWLGIEAGVIGRGRPADLCLFHPERSWFVQAGKLPGKAQNTPFDGRALEGVVLGTWKAGTRVFAA